MAPRPRIAAVLALAALAAAGCTSSGTGGGDSAKDFKGEQRAVATVVDDLESAGTKGDQDRICSDLLASSLVDRLDARGGCRQAVDAALKDTDTSDLSVRSISITGDRAVARVTIDTGDHSRAAQLALVKQDGRWKISGF